jgi:hypothetical protein
MSSCSRAGLVIAMSLTVILFAREGANYSLDALLELPAPPAMPGVRLDPEARAKAIEILARMIAQTLPTSTQPQNEVADE